MRNEGRNKNMMMNNLLFIIYYYNYYYIDIHTILIFNTVLFKYQIFGNSLGKVLTMKKSSNNIFLAYFYSFND